MLEENENKKMVLMKLRRKENGGKSRCDNKESKYGRGKKDERGNETKKGKTGEGEKEKVMTNVATKKGKR